jgi:spermidine synthase
MKSKLRIAIGLSLVAAATLMLELLLMRVFDTIVFSNMAYMIITCAMFAFGLSGVFASLWPISSDTDVGQYIGNVAVGFAFFALALLPIINWIPFDSMALGEEPLRQLISFGLLYVALTVPFFLSGLIFTTVFSSYAAEIRSLYFFDLCGAAVGCVVIIPFIPHIGPGGLLFSVAALCLVAAMLFMDQSPKFGKILGVAGVVLLAIPFARQDGYFDFMEHVDKRGVREARSAGDIELTRWDAIAKIDVMKSYRADEMTGELVLANRHVAYDGGSQSSRLYPFDGDFASLRRDLEQDVFKTMLHFWNRSVFASHRMKADSEADVLIIGAAAGQETKAALVFNAKSVDAIEMVRAVVDISSNEYSNYIGDIYQDPRVNLLVGEGRTFLRSTNKKYDIIQIFSNHTSSSMAAGEGAVGTNYLQTVEAYVEYFSSLKDDGILHINHHIYPRMITTAAAAWKSMGRNNFRDHVIVYERPISDNIPLVMFKMTPWTDAEVTTLNQFMLKPGEDRRDTYSLSEDPRDPRASFLSDEIYSGVLSDSLVDTIPFNIFAATDDRPFFNFLRRQFGELEPSRDAFVNESTSRMLNGMITPTRRIPMDVAHYFVIAVAGTFFALLFILVPLFFSSTGRARWPGEFTSLLYFSCLGAGFIIIELTLIQIFMKLVGYPLYTYSSVIFTMLLAAGLGSNAAKYLNVDPTNRWWIPFSGTIFFGALLWFLHPLVFDIFLAKSMPIRLLAEVIMIFPMSFFMGMALPLGILAIKNKPQGAIAWAWGMNGLFTTIGGLGAGLISLYLGFKITLLIAFAIYVIAGIAFGRLGALSEPSPAA